MSGSNYIVSCPKCQAQKEVRGKAMSLAMTCPSCGVYFRQGTWNKDVTTFANKEKSAIAIGAKGRFDGFLYEVMGFAIKKEQRYKFQWREYLLFNPFKGFAFLSEYNGNWNVLWPIEGDPKQGSVDSSFHYNGRLYQLFQKYSAEVVYAEGEFFVDVVSITESTINYEYIAPPSILSLEQSADSLLWVEGEYISPQEVAEAFNIPVKSLPGKTGRGYTQPILSAFSEQSMITFTVFMLLLLILIQVIFSSSADEKVIYQNNFDLAALKEEKVFVTPSFDIPGSSGNLELNMYAPVDNDWFFAEFSLIEEATGTEYNFTKEVQYYHGYEDGYSWSEGSTYGEALLSKIPGGRYHFNIYPQTSGASNYTFSITATRDVPFTSNFFISIILLLLFPAGYYLRKRILEQRRWSESDYSPYES